MQRRSEQMLNNLGYHFETAASWRKGYATELAQFLIQYGFIELSLQDISVTTKANHLASKHVLENPACVISETSMMLLARRPAYDFLRYRKSGSTNNRVR